jgi:succinate-acetate transporter protein
MKKMLTFLQVSFIIMTIIEAYRAASSLIEGGNGGISLAYCVGYLVISWVIELFIQDDDTPVLR